MIVPNVKTLFGFLSGFGPLSSVTSKVIHQSLHFPLDSLLLEPRSKWLLCVVLFGVWFIGSSWWVQEPGEPALLISALPKGQIAQRDFCLAGQWLRVVSSRCTVDWPT